MNILIIGRAKTGTTACGRSIAAALPNARFVMEPKSADFVEVEPASGMLRFLVRQRKDHLVTKLIFDHWRNRPEELRDLMRGYAGINWDRIVLMKRDPRDEAISALHYSLYVHLCQFPETQDAQVEKWITCMQRKEANPSSISTLQLFQEFDRIFWPQKEPRAFISCAAGAFREFMEDWAPRGFCLSYEDYVCYKWAPLKKYLGFSPVRDYDGPEMRRVSRTRSFGQWKHFFTEADVQDYRRRHDAKLEAMGYTDWMLEPVEALNPEQHSLYLRRIWQEARRDTAARQKRGHRKH